MLLNFQKHEQKATEFLKEVARELGTPEDTGHAGRVLTAVLHALRDKITPEESLHLISQLPLYIKAIYIDGWKLSKTPVRMKNLQEFLSDVRVQAKLTADKDFGADMDSTKTEVEAVFRVIKKHVSEGELKDVKSQLPKELVEML